MLNQKDKELLAEYIDGLKAFKLKEVDKSLISDLEELLTSNFELAPLCVPSYKRRPIARLLQSTKDEGIEPWVYCYEMEDDLYKDFPNRVLVPDAVKRDSKYPLATKLNFILEDQRKRSAKAIFRFDDDSGGYVLPMPSSKSGCSKFKITLNLALHILQFFGEKYNIDFAGLCWTDTLRAVDLSKPGKFYSKVGQVNNGGYVKISDGWLYDDQCGWEDLDIAVQFLLDGKTTRQILVAFTDNFAIDTSTMEYTLLDRLHRSIGCIEKWGIDIIAPSRNFANLNVKMNHTKMRPLNYKIDSIVKPKTLSQEQMHELDNAVVECMNSGANFAHVSELIYKFFR